MTNFPTILIQLSTSEQKPAIESNQSLLSVSCASGLAPVSGQSKSKFQNYKILNVESKLREFYF